MTRWAGVALAAALALAGVARAHTPGDTASPAFEPPAPGTYRLPPIQDAPDGEVIDAGGTRRTLAQLTHGSITLLGLVYTRCPDDQGCPLATWAFGAVRRALRSQPALEKRVRLVTLSFDPVHDTPAVMAAYARRAGGLRRGARWSFLTTDSRASLDPILEALGQDLSVAADSTAVPGTEEFSHTLKAFLIDPRGRVREIYSNAWLHPGMIVNDIVTLSREGP